jgi:hypothetical protein
LTVKVRTSIDDVFINCPFDDAYSAIFDSLVFTIHACGFRPRCSKEVDDGSQTRISKIYNLIAECRYGVHDISRTEPDDINQLPRFNMPLELGIFLGAKRYGEKSQKLKRVLIFDIEKYRYQKFISDLAGIDIKEHGGDQLKAISVLRDWLANVSRREGIPSGPKVIKLYDQFAGALPSIAEKFDFEAGKISYVDYERFVVNWLKEAPASPA